MKFSWVTVTVNNMDESIKFYTEIVGLKVDSRRPTGPEVELAFLGDGETKLELICRKSYNAVIIGEDISLGFEIKSVDTMMAILKEKGMAIHSGPFQPNPHIKFFFITDPNGLRIQFIEHM